MTDDRRAGYLQGVLLETAMPKTAAATPEAHLAELPPGRRDAIAAVRAIPAQEAELKAAFAREGKRLDMGKSCVRFKRAEDLPLQAIGRLIAAVTPDVLIARYQARGR
ncbi:MAG: hypothetical protein ACREOF_18930 [Gemmatimonadales bacterium]